MGERPAHEAYNNTLTHLRDIDRKLATEEKQRFADVHAAMVDAMTKANAAVGPKYDVCGGDGFHSGPNEQLLMAYAFLKGLGINGATGDIQIDMQSGVKQPLALLLRGRWQKQRKHAEHPPVCAVESRISIASCSR